MIENPQQAIPSDPKGSYSSVNSWLLQDMLSQDLLSVDKVHLNVQQSIVITTEDKLMLCLQSHIEQVERSRDWIAPFSLLLSLLLAFVTTDFRDFILPKDTWNALFIIILVISMIWLVITLRHASKKPRLDTLISSIKSGLQDRVEENS